MIDCCVLCSFARCSRFMEHHGGLVFSYNPCYTFTIVVPGVRNVACSPQDDVAVRNS